MTLSNEFKTAVGNKEITEVRIMLKNSILFDHSFKEYDEEYAFASELPKLLEKFDQKETLSDDKSLWSEDYLDSQVSKLMDNFSEERINYVKSIVKYVYKNDKKSVSNIQDNSDDIDIADVLGKIGIVAGAVGVIAGAVLQSAPLIVGGIVIGVAGGATVVANNKSKKG